MKAFEQIRKEESVGFFNNTIKIRVRYWYLMSIAVIYIALFLNFMTIFDLFKMIYNPFQSSKKVTRNAIIISSAAGLFAAFIGLLLTQNPNVSNWSDHIFLAITILNTIAAVVVMIGVTLRLRKSGMS